MQLCILSLHKELDHSYPPVNMGECDMINLGVKDSVLFYYL